MRTLVVEDDPSTSELLEIILKERGHKVTACEDAEHAWDEYLKQPFSLVIVDWILPGRRDGLGLCRQIRGHDEGRNSTLLVCTPGASLKIWKQC
jgi:DNA-binding response OmpR family regulator